MCDSTTCDYKYYVITLCLVAITETGGADITQTSLDACCGASSSLGTALNTACTGQTTLLGVTQAADFHLSAESMCNSGQALINLAGDAGAVKVGVTAMVGAVGVATLNLF